MRLRWAGTVAAMAVVAMLASGCVSEAPSEPDAAEVVAARDAAHENIDRQLAALPQVVPGASRFARVEVDTCREGEHNWKVNGPILTECQIQLASAYSFDANFPQIPHSLHDFLIVRGWAPASETTSILEEVSRWDREDRSIGDLPSAYYLRGGDDIRSKTVERLRIVFGSDTSPDDWTGRHGFELSTPDMVEWAARRYGVYYSSVTGTAWGQAWQQAGKPGPYVLVLTFTYIYFRTFRK